MTPVVPVKNGHISIEQLANTLLAVRNMKFNTIKLTLALCYWKQIFLPRSSATECGKKLDKKLHLIERGEITIEKPTYMGLFSKDETHYILVSTSAYCVYALRTTFIDDNSVPILLKDDLQNPGTMRQAPDGAFKFPAVVFVDKYARKQNARVFVIDITDISNPKNYIISSVTTANITYGDLLFRSEREFLISETYEKWHHHLKHYKSKPGNETAAWTDKIFGKVKILGMVLYRNISNTFDAIFAFDESSLKVIWSEDEFGKPGDWTNTNHYKMATIDTAPMYTGLQLEDINEDGWPDLLVTVSTKLGDVWVYEIASPGGFRDGGSYKRHELATNLKGKSLKCPEEAKAFIPMAGHEGKPWILVTGPRCTTAHYLVPESNIAKNWNYKVYKISDEVTRQGSMVAFDFDQDGLMDLFASLYDDNLVRVYSFTEPNKTDVHDSESSSNYVKLSHVILHFTCITYVIISL